MFESRSVSAVQGWLLRSLLGPYVHGVVDEALVAGVRAVSAAGSRRPCLDDAGLLDLVADVDAVVARLQGLQVRALAELASRFEGEGAGEFTADEVAFRMRWGT
ncbi:MAG: hypothetical protein ACLGIV_01775, partial [Actinomycetes bacterium]